MLINVFVSTYNIIVGYKKLHLIILCRLQITILRTQKKQVLTEIAYEANLVSLQSITP